MDRVKRYFNKPWNPTVMQNMNPIPDNVHAHLCMVYWTLFATTKVSSFGTYSHLFLNTGGWTTTLTFVASIIWLSKVQPQRELPRLMILLTAAYCFGASIGPLINFIAVVDQSDIIRVVVGASVFFFCYAISSLYSQERAVIYGVAEFLATISVPTWMVLFPKLTEITMPTYFLGLLILWGTAVFIHDFVSPKFKIWFDLPLQAAWFGFLRYHFRFKVFHLWVIYLSLLPFTVSMMTHSQDSIYKASRGEDNFVSHTIAFFTHFPARIALTAPRHIAWAGGVMLSKICGFLRHQ